MAPGDPAGTGETARTLRLKCQAAQPQPQRGPREIAVPVQRIRHIPQASGMSQGGPVWLHVSGEAGGTGNSVMITPNSSCLRRVNISDGCRVTVTIQRGMGRRMRVGARGLGLWPQGLLACTRPACPGVGAGATWGGGCRGPQTSVKGFPGLVLLMLELNVISEVLQAPATLGVRDGPPSAGCSGSEVVSVMKPASWLEKEVGI